MRMTLNPAQQKLIDDLAAYGLHIVLVGPHDGRNEHFGYTVGLERFHGWPELILFGLEARLTSALLNNAVEELRRKGRAPVAGMMLDQVADGAVFKLIEQPALDDDTLAMALWHREHRGEEGPPRALQVAWPDEQGRFPDEADCDAATRAVQMPRDADAENDR